MSSPDTRLNSTEPVNLRAGYGYLWPQSACPRRVLGALSNDLRRNDPLPIPRGCRRIVRGPSQPDVHCEGGVQASKAGEGFRLRSHEFSRMSSGGEKDRNPRQFMATAPRSSAR